MTIHQDKATEHIYDSDQSCEHNVLTSQLKGLADLVGQSVQNSTAIHEVEQGICSRLLQLGHQVLTLFFDSCGDGDMGSEVRLDNGRCVRRLPDHYSREYGSIFGEFRFDRVAYGSRK